MPDPLPPVDPNVRLPDVVSRAAADADALHKQTYGGSAAVTPPPPDATPPAPPAATPPAAPTIITPVPPAVPPAPAADASPPSPTPPPAPAPEPPPAPVTADEWERRYRSMEGRFKQSQNVIQSMQTQMSELGDELVRTQRAVAQPPQQTPQPLITEEDRTNYGPELIDLITRAAKAAVSPDLDGLRQENTQVQQRVMQQARSSVLAALSEVVPDWQDIDRSPEFKAWCRLRDVYSGQVRGNLLNAALRTADAPRVIAFFKGFLAERATTGHIPDPSVPPPPAPPPRQAAVALDTIATPGRLHPAGTDNPVVTPQRVVSRKEISDFYARVRSGAYAGREQDKMRDEQEIFAAQREGRVR